MAFDREFAALHGWLDHTDRVALEHLRAGATAELKADGTPVTEADRAIERMLRDAIEASFPGDAVLGEEQGASGDASRRWIVDPIDGTKNFARGIPVFATLVALEQDGELVLGMVSAPALGARWWASAGDGAFRDGAPIRVSSTEQLADAHICSGDVIRYGETGEGSDPGRRLDGFIELGRRCARFRAFGDFWGHMLVAEGAMDVMVEFADLSVWDLAAVAVIVTEAGGKVTSVDGSTGVRSGPVLASNGMLHEQVLAILNGE
ncbi:MAG TPA: inositol monophosphatase family protein [Actinomycetota bacterium]